MDCGEFRSVYRRHVQLDAMLDFLEEHPSLAVSRYGKHNSKLWDACAEKLNAFPDGAFRDGMGWSKCWRSWKNRVRMKEQELRDLPNSKETPVGLGPITERDQRLLYFIQKVEQDALVVDNGLNDESDDSNWNNEENLNNHESGSDNVVLATVQNKTVEHDPFRLDYYNKKKVTSEQLESLIGFLQKYPALAKGSMDRKHNPKLLWTKCAKKLNAFPIGSKRNAEGWSKVWRDLKYQVRQKALRIREAKEDSGLSKETFTNRDKLVLRLIGGQIQTKKRERTHSPSSVKSEELENTIIGRSHATESQMTCLLQFLHEHKDMARRSQGNGKSLASLWAKLAKKLNAIEGGAKKTPCRWAKMWRDVKCKTRKKARLHKEAIEKGELDALPPISERDEFILNLIGPNERNDVVDIKVEVLSEDDGDFQNDEFANTVEVDNAIEICEENYLPDNETQQNDTREETQFYDSDEDMTSRFLKQQKQSLHNTKAIGEHLRSISVNMERLTTALFDLTDILSRNASHIL